MKRVPPSILAIVLGALLAPACVEPLDTHRVVPERGSLGEEVYKVLCGRVANTAYPDDTTGIRSRALCNHEALPNAATPPRLRTLAENRDKLVDAVDRIFPELVTDDMQHFMVELLPLYDPPDDQLPQQTRAAAALVEKLLQDDEALAAIERMGHRQGYRPLSLAVGAARPLLTYPGFSQFARTTLRVIDDDGSARDEWQALLRVVALEMASSDPPSTDTTPTTFQLTRDLLLSTRTDFGGPNPVWLALRDSRGLAVPALDAGAMHAPFADEDGDGLADIDEVGEFVAQGGGILGVPTPFATAIDTDTVRDDAGRAMWDDGSLVYQYRDLNPTFLAGLLRETPNLFDPAHASALDLAAALPMTLGPTMTRTERIGNAELEYEGFDTSQGPLFDLLHAVGSVLSRTELDDALLFTQQISNQDESAFAGLVDAIWYANSHGDTIPDARLVDDSTFWDETLALGEESAQRPGLVEAMLRALTDPRTKNLGPVMARFMRYKDRFYYDSDHVNNPAVGDLMTLVDRSQPDTADNQSVFQRTASLIHDLEGVRLCNKQGAVLRLYVAGAAVLRWPLTGSYDECELVEVPDVAQLYAQSIVGRAEIHLKDNTLNTLLQSAQHFGIVDIDDMLQSQSGIHGLTTHPTPQALGRLVFSDWNDFVQGLFSPPLTRDGVPVRERHNGTMPMWEKPVSLPDGTQISFLEALAPLMQAFVDHTRPGQLNPFVRLVSITHSHLPSPQSPTTQSSDPSAPYYAQQSDIRSYEPLIADIMDQGEMLTRVRDFIIAADRTQVHSGTDGIDVLAATTELLLNPLRSCGSSCVASSLAYRDGRRYPCDNHGVCAVDNAGNPTRYVSPMVMIVDALHSFDQTFAANPDLHARWLAGRGGVTDQLFMVNRNRESFSLSNRRAHAVLDLLVPYIRGRIAAHRQAGDLDEWARTLDTRSEETFGSAISTAIIRFAAASAEDPESASELSGLLSYLGNESASEDAFPTMLLAVGDLLQLVDDDKTTVPLVRALSRAVATNAPDVAADGGTLNLDDSTASETLELLRRIHDVDDRGTIDTVAQNLMRLDPGDTETPIEALVDIVTEVNRADPGAGGPLNAEDIRSVLGQTRDFLIDDSHGLERLYQIIQHREIHR